MKKFFIYFLIFFSQCSSLFAMPINNMILKIQFDSNPNKPFYNQPLHLKQVIHIDPAQSTNQLVTTESKIENNFPTTIALLIKPTQLTNNKVALQFNLVHYSFEKL